MFLTRELHLFFNALTFFTRLPAPGWVQFSEAHLNHASRYFPLVGLLLGTLAAALYWLLEPLLPLPLTLLLCTLFTILLTGGFHEDGLADVCDGFGGGWTPEQTLGIMKDSRLGSYGALGLLLALAFRLTALLYVPDVLIALLLGHTLSRFLAVSLIYSETYVQQDRLSKAKPLASRMSGRELLIAGAPALLCLLLIAPVLWLPLLLSLLALRFYLVRLFRRRLGGYTGDCLGATQQISEIAVYLVLSLPLGGLLP